MSKIVILNRRKIRMYSILAAVVVLAGAYIGWQQTRPTAAPVEEGAQVLQLVTGEFSAETDGGQKLESYVFSPSTVFAKKNRPVELRISGINGQTHPFVIEGLDISGKINKGKTTIVNFTPKEAGVYSIICQTHGDAKNGGPMVGYLVVQ